MTTKNQFIIYTITQGQPQKTPQYDCGEGQEMADTYKACQPFLPLSRLFCSANFQQQNVLTEPLKKSVLNWAGTLIRITAKALQISTDYILFHRSFPRYFSILSMTFLKTS